MYPWTLYIKIKGINRAVYYSEDGKYSVYPDRDLSDTDKYPIARAIADDVSLRNTMSKI
jgi:hypothetical protein